MLPEQNPKFPEGINASQDNPLIEFLWLAVALLVSMVVLVMALSFAVRWLAPYVPFSWEQRLSAGVGDYVHSLESQPDAYGAEQQRAEDALRTLATELLDSSFAVPIEGGHQVESVPVEAYRFYLMPATSPNAFATLGGNVMVTSALLGEVESENGLAMVIAHEIAHIQLRHPLEAIGRGVLLQLALGMLVSGGDSAAVGGVVGSGTVLAALSFSRQMELAADARALRILRQHYGHLGGADEFFASMQHAQDAALWVEFASTHPDSEQRLALIHEAMRQDTSTAPLRPVPAGLLHGAVVNHTAPD